MSYNPVSDVPFDTHYPVNELLVSDIPNEIREMKKRINEVAAGIYDAVATVGQITIWPFETLPSNGHYLEVNGGTTAGKPKLQAIFGSNLPDYRGYFLRGWSHGSSTSPDIDTVRSIGSIQGWAVGSHVHGGVPRRMKAITGSDNDVTIEINLFETPDANTYENSPLKDNRPTNVAVMYIIRAE